MSTTWLILQSKMLVEGAFNETLAVVIMSFQKEQCTDYAIQKFLTDIIREEAEHAELVWDTLRWLIDKGGDAVVDALWTLLERDFTLTYKTFLLLNSHLTDCHRKTKFFSKMPIITLFFPI